MIELVEQYSQIIFPPDSQNNTVQACHAASLVETGRGLFAAWFAGKKEGKDDVCIWGASYDKKKWQKPFLIVKGLNSKGEPTPCWNPVLTKQPDGKLILYYKVGSSPRTWWGMRCTSSDNGKKKWQKPFLIVKGLNSKGEPTPCWNPVLTKQPDGKLILYYKVGSSPRTWWGMRCTSSDNGQTWSIGEKLPDGFLGPIKNKPIWLNDVLVCPSSTEHNGWQVHFELYKNSAYSKTHVEDPRNLQAIQPTLLKHNNGKLQALCRTRRRKVIATSFSLDNGHCWSPLQETKLPNPNSGIDAISLKKHGHLIVYNHTTKGRTPLNISLSDDGINWSKPITLESTHGEYSYPAVIQGADEQVHILYTWRRQSIRHRTFIIKPGISKN